MTKHCGIYLAFFCFSLYLGAAHPRLPDKCSFDEDDACTSLPSFDVFYKSISRTNHAFPPALNAISSDIAKLPKTSPLPQVKTTLKRKRDDDDGDRPEKKRSKMTLKMNKKCESPVMLALLHGVAQEQGGQFIDPQNGIIQISDLEKLLNFIAKNVKKSQKTINNFSRLEGIKKWFYGFKMDKLWDQTYTIELRPAKIKSYARLFN